MRSVRKGRETTVGSTESLHWDMDDKNCRQ